MPADLLTSLRGQSVVITGSTRGFGRVLAARLAELGARVVVSGPFAEESEAVAKELAALGGDVVWSRGDVTKADDVRALVRTAVEAFGGIDVWINNAAFETPQMARVLDFGDDDVLSGSAVWERTTQVNVLGTGRCTLAALELMVGQGYGTIVNVTGRGDDLRPTKFTAPYGASKAWLRAFTKTLRAEYADSGVNLVAFNPGIMTTERMGRAHFDQAHANAKVEKQLETVTRILGDPPEVAADKLVAFLASPSRATKKELRLITPLHAAKGVAAEVRRRVRR